MTQHEEITLLRDQARQYRDQRDALLKAARRAETRLVFLLDGCEDNGKDPDHKALRYIRAAIAKTEAR